MYWFDSKKISIEWRGNFKGNHFSLVEDDYHDENLQAWIPEANVELQLSGKKISGTWQNYKAKEFLKVYLEKL